MGEAAEPAQKGSVQARHDEADRDGRLQENRDNFPAFVKVNPYRRREVC
jgi:hypothetical protein